MIPTHPHNSSRTKTCSSHSRAKAPPTIAKNPTVAGTAILSAKLLEVAEAAAEEALPEADPDVVALAVEFVVLFEQDASLG